MTIRRRSRLGCFGCRRKKRKCDQTKPICSLCSKSGTVCEWPVPGQENKNKQRRMKIEFRQFENTTEVIDNVFDVEELLLYEVPKISTPEAQLMISPNYETSPFGLDIMDQFPVYESPLWPLVLSLNTKQLEYFEYYCQNVAPVISVVPKKFNYFLKLFLPMAHHNKSVLYALVAWGGIFKAHHDNLPNSSGKQLIHTVKFHIQESENTFITSLTAYLILMCIEITTGSTFGWSGYLTNCYDLINKMGGFKVLKNYSDDGKILAENFAYFDILASQSNENGTYYPVSEYNSIFLRDGNMVDPLQGCTRPLILILGNVINLVVEFKMLDSRSPDYYEKLDSILRRASIQETKLAEAKIYQNDYKLLKDADEFIYHEQMFKLYSISIQLYIKLALRRLPAVVPEIQLLLKRANSCLAVLIESPLKLGLCFPLLIAGLNSVAPEDRLTITQRLDYMKQKYEFNSIAKIEMVILEVWNLNFNGCLCIDYFEVTKKFGWKFNIGR